MATTTSSQLKDRIEEAILRYDSSLARTLIKEVEPLLAQSDLTPQQLAGLERVRAQLASIALRFQSDSAIQELLAEHPMEVVSVYDSEELINKFNARLGHEPFIDDRDRLRDSWLASLQVSKERIGSQPIQLGSEQVDPTIANWIKVFVSSVGTGKVSNVKRAGFYSKNSSVASLPEKDRKALRKILDLYEFFQLRSDEIESLSGQFIIEDAKGNEQLLSKDDAEPLYTEADIRELKAQAEAGELSAGRIIDLRIAFPEAFSDVPVPLKTKGRRSPKAEERAQSSAVQFFEEMEQKYPTPKIPSSKSISLDLLIQDMNAPGRSANRMQGELMAIFSERSSFASFLRDKRIAEYIQNHFPKDLGEKNRQLVSQTTLNSISVQALLESLFVQKLQLSEEEALWRSYQILQQLPMALKEFRTVVTYDVKKGSLAWRYSS